MEDRIDFPCSDTYRDALFELGVTAYPSSSYISGRDQAFIDAMDAIVSALRDLQEERRRGSRPSPPEGLAMPRR